MEFIEFLQDKWIDIMVVSAIGVSLTLCASASISVTIKEFNDGDYSDFGFSLIIFAYFAISLIYLIAL